LNPEISLVINEDPEGVRKYFDQVANHIKDQGMITFSS